MCVCARAHTRVRSRRTILQQQNGRRFFCRRRHHRSSTFRAEDTLFSVSSAFSPRLLSFSFLSFIVLESGLLSLEDINVQLKSKICSRRERRSCLHAFRKSISLARAPIPAAIGLIALMNFFSFISASATTQLLSRAVRVRSFSEAASSQCFVAR